MIERLPGYVGQIVLLALVAWLAWRGLANFLGNVRGRGVPIGFGFLHAEAGFEIAQSIIAFGPASSYLDAVIVATLNTLLVIALASLFSTLIALGVAFGRLSSHPLIRGASSVYVEVFRNIPLLLQIFFWYFSAMALLPGVGDSLQFGAVLLNNRGLFFPTNSDDVRGRLGSGRGSRGLCRVVRADTTLAQIEGRPRALARWRPLQPCFSCYALRRCGLMHAQFWLDSPRAEGFNVSGGFALLPELMALTLGLSIYNSTFLAEIFRAGILSVPRGQIRGRGHRRPRAARARRC